MIRLQRSTYRSSSRYATTSARACRRKPGSYMAWWNASCVAWPSIAASAPRGKSMLPLPDVKFAQSPKAPQGALQAFEARAARWLFAPRSSTRSGSAKVKGKTVAILEARVSEQMADLVRKYGGTPVLAPALSELPDIDPAHISELLDEWNASPPEIFIFQTGVGVKALLATTDALGSTDRLLRVLAGAQVVVRGPKPTAVLRSREVRIDLSAQEPYTTTEVLAELEGKELAGKRVVVQRYGETNQELHQELEKRG